MNKTAILLIEHGRTAFDREGRVHGRFDPPLDAKGREQAESLGARLRRAMPDVLYSSDRKRAAQTARIAGRIAGIPVRPSPELRPLDVGDFSGRPEKQVAAALEPYFAHPGRKIPGGESVADWRARHTAFARRVAAQGGKPAFVTHSNVIGSLRAAATGAADGRHAMANPPKSASITIVRFGSKR